MSARDLPPDALGPAAQRALPVLNQPVPEDLVALQAQARAARAARAKPGAAAPAPGAVRAPASSAAAGPAPAPAPAARAAQVDAAAPLAKAPPRPSSATPAKPSPAEVRPVQRLDQDGAAQAAARPASTRRAPAPADGLDKPAALRAFEHEAEGLISARRTRGAKAIVRTAALLLVVLVAWASWAQVDEVTKGEAKVISSKQLQQIQSLDGGVVTEILVREGQVVEAGQVLLKIDETRATSGARENAAQGIALQARLARLRALAEGGEFRPPAVSSPDEQRIVDEEQRLYQMRRAELSNLMQINQQQLAQRQQELSEMRARKSAADRGLELGSQELARTRPLLSTGAVSEVDILKLDRDVSRSRGESEQASAQILRSQASIGEAQRKMAETELTFRNEARRDLAEAMGRLNALNQSAVALNDKVDKSQIKSPVRGRVQRLLANTVGGVVTPGKDIVEIVPLDDKLVLEAKVNPRDIAFIHPGQAASVKFTAYDASIYGGLDAVVENISPDTVVDEKGNAFYLVRVQTKQAQLGQSMPIIPGMTAEVDVLTGKKSVMSYLLKPVLKVKQNALRER